MSCDGTGNGVTLSIECPVQVRPEYILQAANCVNKASHVAFSNVIDIFVDNCVEFSKMLVKRFTIRAPGLMRFLMFVSQKMLTML